MKTAGVEEAKDMAEAKATRGVKGMKNGVR